MKIIQDTKPDDNAREYYIRAEFRADGKRERITEYMTRAEAEAWTSNYQLRKHYKYFRVCQKGKEQKCKNKIISFGGR